MYICSAKQKTPMPMTNKDFALAVNRFFYYANNWTNKEITFPTFTKEDKTVDMPAFFEAFPKGRIEWLWSEWNYCYKTYGARGVMMAFYAELDGINRALLLKWINENYSLEPEDFGLTLETIEED